MTRYEKRVKKLHDHVLKNSKKSSKESKKESKNESKSEGVE